MKLQKLLFLYEQQPDVITSWSFVVPQFSCGMVTETDTKKCTHEPNLECCAVSRNTALKSWADRENLCLS